MVEMEQILVVSACSKHWRVGENRGREFGSEKGHQRGSFSFGSVFCYRWELCLCHPNALEDGEVTGVRLGHSVVVSLVEWRMCHFQNTAQGREGFECDEIATILASL